MSATPIVLGQTNEQQKGNVPVRAQPPTNPKGGTVLGSPTGGDLFREIGQFRGDCANRYRFNSRCDNALNVIGILVSVGIVASGTYHHAEYAAILGAFVAAVVSAQKAFPFGQRTHFYRILMGQGANLETDVQQGLVSNQDAVAILKSLRLDYAQQLPRGSTFNSGGDSGPATSSQ